MAYGRTTTAYVSGYVLDRVQVIHAQRTQKRPMVANLKGAILPEQTIVSATWKTNSPWVTIFDPTASISTDGKSTTVSTTFANGGWGSVKVECTLNDGQKFNQMFNVRVVDMPWFDETFQSAGPYSVTTP
jgi:hypothetical protein